jgi:DNA-binding beta-propeller fold protein YncE/mono/diheme cytochrome c family protein
LGLAALASLFLNTPARAAGPLTPTEVAASPDGRTLYVALEGGGAVGVVDRATFRLSRSIPCPGVPRGLAVLDAGRTLAVAGGANPGWLALVDAATGRALRTIPLGHTPRAPVATADGRLFVLEQFDGTIAEIDRDAGAVRRRFAALREPVAAATTPDGGTLLVANLLPAVPADRGVVSAALTRVDTRTGAVVAIPLPNGSTAVRGVAVLPDGRHAVAVHLLGRFHLPTSQLDRGWMTTNALSVIDLAADAVAGTVLLDEVDRGAANPWGVAVSADGGRIVVTHAGTHELSVIDATALLAKLAGPHAIPPADDLAFLVGLRRRVRLNADVPANGEPALQGPRGLALVEGAAYAAVAFGDVLARVPLEGEGEGGPVTTLALGPPPEVTPERRGEKLFSDATVCFQGWQSCATCHPDTRADGLNWDLLNDAMGNPKNTKSLLLAHATPPSMFLGIRADAATAVRAGFHHILFAEPGEDRAAAVEAYLRSLAPAPGPERADDRPSPAAERGGVLFASDRLRCARCHPAPLFTDLKMHDVRSRGPRDREPAFDTPTLVESWRTAPYLHDGRYPTLDALLRDGRHGMDGDAVLTDAELHDLVAYLRSL